MEHFGLRVGRASGRSCQERRRLAFDQIATHGFAGHGLVAEGAHHVVAHLERVAERQPVRTEVGGGVPRLVRERASTAPRCSGRSIVYLPDLYRQIRSDLTMSRVRWTPPRMSRYWPMFSSIRSSFQIFDACGGRLFEELVGVDECEVTDEDRDAFAEATGIRPPHPLLGVLGGRDDVGGRLAAA